MTENDSKTFGFRLNGKSRKIIESVERFERSDFVRRAIEFLYEGDV